MSSLLLQRLAGISIYTEYIINDSLRASQIIGGLTQISRYREIFSYRGRLLKEINSDAKDIKKYMVINKFNIYIDDTQFGTPCIGDKDLNSLIRSIRLNCTLSVNECNRLIDHDMNVSISSKQVFDICSLYNNLRDKSIHL